MIDYYNRLYDRYNFLLLYYPFINHVLEFFFQVMVIEMVFNNEIQIFFSN